MGTNPDPSPMLVASLRYLDRAVAAIHADFLARQAHLAASAAFPGGESEPALLSGPAGGIPTAGFSLRSSGGHPLPTPALGRASD